MIYDQRVRISQVEENIELLPFYFSSAKSIEDLELRKAKSIKILNEIENITKAVNNSIKAKEISKEE